jgi:hypothetical protein
MRFREFVESTEGQSINLRSKSYYRKKAGYK